MLHLIAVYEHTYLTLINKALIKKKKGGNLFVTKYVQFSNVSSLPSPGKSAFPHLCKVL